MADSELVIDVTEFIGDRNSQYDVGVDLRHSGVGKAVGIDGDFGAENQC